jgi:hypothetical protein
MSVRVVHEIGVLAARTEAPSSLSSRDSTVLYKSRHQITHTKRYVVRIPNNKRRASKIKESGFSGVSSIQDACNGQ